jgi:hypothetical protein
MRLAHAPQHQLVGLGVVLDPDRRVLGGHPAEGLGELVLVGLALRHDRDGEEWLGQ